jgi:hypothetical protein
MPASSVFYKARPAVKRVQFKEKSTTRGIQFKQSTIKPTPSPSRGPSKPPQPVEGDVFEQSSDEPLIQPKGKVS